MALSHQSNPALGFAAAATLLAIVGTLVVATAWQFIQDSRWVARTSAVLTQVDRVAHLERHAVAAQRGYLLTGEEALKVAFWEARAEVPQQLRELDAIVAYPPVAAQLDVLEVKILQRLNLATRTLTLFDQQGLAQAQTFIQTNGSQTLDREIQALFDDIRHLEAQLLEQRRTTSERSARWLLLATASGIPLSLLILGVVYRRLQRENRQRRHSEQVAETAAAELGVLSSDMAALSRYAAMLQSCEGQAELLAISRQALATLLPGVGCTIYLLRASRDHAEVAAQWGQHGAHSQPMPAPTDCWCVRRNHPYSCDDVRVGVRCAHVEDPADDQTAATACVPLSAQGELLGWLYLSKPGSGPVLKGDVALQAAEQLSLALANLRLREDLRHQSIRDPLTGLFNRRYLEESLAREVSRCQRRKLSIVVMMLDLDAFKAFNDRHGHPGGDALLSAFGRLLQSSCRPEDIPCRFGGEEFTLILPEAEAEIGLQRARSILAATAQLIVQHQGMPLGRVTTSIGMAVLPEHGTTTTALLEAADAALYRAKAEGRNRVCTANNPTGTDSPSAQ